MRLLLVLIAAGACRGEAREPPRAAPPPVRVTVLPSGAAIARVVRRVRAHGPSRRPAAPPRIGEIVVALAGDQVALGAITSLTPALETDAALTGATLVDLDGALVGIAGMPLAAR
jgi:hypothetical protein